MTVVVLMRRRPAERVEQWVLAYVVGGVLVCLVTSHVAPAVKVFVGFDDSQGLVGADLLSRGWFPWRDFLFVHGLFDDALRSALGFRLFGHTVWGSQTVTLSVWAPLCWAGLYAVASWAARCRAAVLFTLAVPLVALAHTWQSETSSFVRWIGTPVVLLALAAALGERHSGRRTAVLSTLLFVDAILTPEAAFLVIAVSVVLVASDVCRASAGASLSTRFRRTMTFVLVGASLACVWAVFLATQHALGGFLDYYTVFVGDHNATGARNVSHTRSGFPVFVILVSVTLVCVLWLGHRVVSHRKMSDREWVLAASTLFAGLYAEKALGRFDYSHIYESFFSALPMMIIGGALCLEWADGRVAAFLKTAPGKLSDQAGVASRHVLHLRGASVSALLALLLVPPAVAMGTQIPSHNKVALSSLHSDPLVGYDAGGHRIVHTARSLERVVNQLDPQGPVFDFGNAPGYVHFLLQRDPSTRFTNMGLALTPPAQELLLQELRADPPRLVVFDAGTLGASRWDSISNDVRTYRVAQYLLDGWTPIRSVDGFLVMLRNDLLGTSTATTVPSHADRAALYSSTPACLWGYSANYLSSPPQGGSLTLPLRPVTSTVRGRTSVAIVPKDVRLADYALATFTAPGPIGHAHVVISDKADQAPWHEIRFRVLPFSGARASVRVGSCLQWHGYGTRRLYVTQTHGRPLTSIMLSGVG